MQFKSESFVFEGSAAERLDRVLKQHFAGSSWAEVRRLIESGKLTVAGKLTIDAGARIPPGSTLVLQMNAPKARPGHVVDDNLVVYHDAHVVVVRKPEGISSIVHEGETESVEQRVQDWLSAREPKRAAAVHVVHRLDKVTSGVMLFARTMAAKLALKEQFRAHTVGRLYLALVNGAMRDGTLKFRMVRNRGDGLRGVTNDANRGYFSTTHVRVREQFARCSLVECRLETGRTHQIRIHLSHVGHPIVGENLYSKGFDGPLLTADRVMLHAATLSFDHPVERRRLAFDEPLAPSFREYLDRVAVR